MSSTGSTLPSIDKLLGRENFQTWQFAVRTYLEHEGLLKCIDGTETDVAKISKAKTKIILLLDPVNYVHVQGCHSAEEVWNKLKAAFDDSGLCRRVSLLRSLITTKLDDCGSTAEFVNSIISTAQKLNGIGFTVADEWIGTLLLAGLPERFSPMIMGIESTAVKITGDFIKTKLLQDVNLSANQNAFVSQDSSNMKNQSPNLKGVRCFSCSAYGHKANSCPNNSAKKSANFHTSKSSKANGGYKKKSAFSAVFSTNTFDSNNWYIDSGASAHYTMRDDWMISNHKSNAREITVANNSKLKVISSGIVNVNVNNSGSSNIIPINNVHFVPNLAANLLSVSQLVKKNFSVIFDKNGCRIVDADGDVCATAKMINDVYKLDLCKTNNNQCFLTKAINENTLWHQRLGHMNQDALLKLNNGLVSGIKFKPSTEDKCCAICSKGKQSRLSFPKNGSRATDTLGIIHSDLCGIMECKSLGGANYFLTFIDDFTRKVFVYFLKSKSDVKELFDEYRALVETQTGKKIKILRTDNGLEFCNKELDSQLRKAGIIHQTSNTYTPQQNGLAERMNRTLVEKARCMLFESNLPKYFWAEAISTAAYIYNRSPTRSVTGKTPEEAWSNKIPDISHMKTFGCMAMVHIPKEKRKKWDSKSQELIFVGYCSDTKGYRLVNMKSKSVVKSRDVVFMENKFLLSNLDNQFYVSETKNKVILSFDEVVGLNVSNLEDNDQSTFESEEEVYLTDDASESEDITETTIVPEPILRRSGRDTKPIDRLEVGFFTAEAMGDPTSVKEAMRSPASKLWRKAMEEEFNSLQINQTWELIDLPPNKKAIGVKWVFKTKRDIDGTAKYCVGFHVTRDRIKGELFLDQEKHIRELLDRYNMANCNSVSTPTDPNQKLCRDMAPKTSDEMEEMSNVPYQEAVGSLLYIAQGTRPDIAYAVNTVSKFNQNPGKPHWNAVKRIMRYLKGTIKAKLLYSKDGNQEIVGYCDADWASDSDDRRSVTGYCFIKQNGPISWSSKRQKTVALSTTEAEYMSLSTACQEALWLRQFQQDLLVDGNSNINSTLIRCDNRSAIDLSYASGYHARTKHIDIRHHFHRQHIADGHIEVQHIDTDNMTADILTKPLFKPKHYKFSKLMGLKFIDD
jgi:hypothetical protein